MESRRGDDLSSSCFVLICLTHVLRDYLSLQLWFYEYFSGLAPQRRRGAVHDFSVGASWRDRGESRVESVPTLRGLLHRGTSSVSVRLSFVAVIFPLTFPLFHANFLWFLGCH